MMGQSYDEIKVAISSAPVTWLPGLLKHLVQEALAKKVFVEKFTPFEHGLTSFVKSVINAIETRATS
jgi:hypothetical protein